MIIDPGLQPPRTALAWNRTGLAVVVNAVVVLRSGLTRSSLLVTALGAVMLLIAAGAIVCGAWRRRWLVRGDLPIAPPAWLVGATMAAMTFICLASLAAILVGPSL